jgi:hypothetical protein
MRRPLNLSWRNAQPPRKILAAVGAGKTSSSETIVFPHIKRSKKLICPICAIFWTTGKSIKYQHAQSGIFASREYRALSIFNHDHHHHQSQRCTTCSSTCTGAATAGAK